MMVSFPCRLQLTLSVVVFLVMSGQRIAAAPPSSVSLSSLPETVSAADAPIEQSHQREQQRRTIEVTVYYETLCSDSLRFVQRLLPIWRAFQQQIDLRLVPYGKAIHNFNATTGVWKIECQHGPAECELNILHACVLEQLADKEDSGMVTASAFELIACSMRSFSSSLENCARQQSIDLTPANECAASAHGTELFVRHGERTQRIGLTFVPTVVIDQEFDWYAQPDWRNHFERLFCRAYRKKYAEQLAKCSDADADD